MPVFGVILVLISLSSIGKRALESHMRGVRHNQKAPVNAGCIFKTVRKTTLMPISTHLQQHPKLQSSLRKQWRTLKSYRQKYIGHFQLFNLSLNFCNDLNSLFWKLFADSDTGRSYSMAKTKLFYVINFGLATHFRTLLHEKLVKSPFCTVCFDESLNEVAQKCQIDFSLRP